MSNESEKSIETKVKELENVRRLVNNTINLINDVEIKGAYAGPVAEILGWLSGFNTSINNQITVLQDALPKTEPVKVAEAEAVKA